MKVVVIGANGQLGTDVCLEYEEEGHDVHRLNHDRLDVSDLATMRGVLTAGQPDVVINTTAMHKVEACEEDLGTAFEVNAIGPRHLAQLSNEIGYSLVHISTDYVFDGQKGAPYDERDTPRPLNAYGVSKLAGELLVRAIAKRHFVVRVAALFGEAPCRAKGGLNFVQMMIKLGGERDEVRVVDDEIVSPTNTVDVARQLRALTSTEHFGLYHMTSDGAYSWFEFAQLIWELAGLKAALNVARPGEFPTTVRRPAYSALANNALDSLGIDQMPGVRTSLRSYLASTGQLMDGV